MSREQAFGGRGQHLDPQGFQRFLCSVDTLGMIGRGVGLLCSASDETWDSHMQGNCSTYCVSPQTTDI